MKKIEMHQVIEGKTKKCFAEEDQVKAMEDSGWKVGAVVKSVKNNEKMSPVGKVDKSVSAKNNAE